MNTLELYLVSRLQQMTTMEKKPTKGFYCASVCTRIQRKFGRAIAIHAGFGVIKSLLKTRSYNALLRQYNCTYSTNLQLGSRHIVLVFSKSCVRCKARTLAAT